VIRKIICINAVCISLMAALFCVYPPLRTALSLRDPALKQPGVPKIAWRLSRSLASRYASWAHRRIATPDASGISKNETFSPEWMVFGSVMYLQAVENLQAAWDAGDHTSVQAPKVFAREAIVAASEVVIDPGNARWVVDQWGSGYLHNGDVFHRALIISALTSREQLLHDGAHVDLLRDQVEGLSHELDASPGGLLEDYPGMCYPCDVLAAIACVRRADAVLHQDHSAFVTRAMRSFTASKMVRLGQMQAPALASRHSVPKEIRVEAYLPPYQANLASGQPVSAARGCANSRLCLVAPELWPAEATEWFRSYEEFFWQRRFGAVGFREFRRDAPGNQWMYDSGAGAVLGGYSVVGNVFGLGASRRNGRFDLAYPLATELLAAAWELPGGVLAVPRVLSNLSDAPTLGESALLWQFTIQPEKGFPLKTGGTIPPCVYVVLIGVLVFGAWRILESIWTIREAWGEREPEVRRAGLQIALWLLCLAGAMAAAWTERWWLGLCLVLVAQLFPGWKKPPVDDWDEKARAQQAANPPK